MEEKIIEVAKALFIEKGYAETSMSEIAAKAGINRPGLHYFFVPKTRCLKQSSATFCSPSFQRSSTSSHRKT